MTTLLGISGALRAQSTNTMLIRNAAAALGADTFIEADIRFPLYDGDIEETDGVPAAVKTLAEQIAQADAVVISTPEYNRGIPGVLKNALDWVSRAGATPWADKPVAIMSATAGRSGGERAQTNLVASLVPFGAKLVLGSEVLIGANYESFDDAGNLTNEMSKTALADLMQRLKAAI